MKQQQEKQLFLSNQKIYTQTNHQLKNVYVLKQQKNIYQYKLSLSNIFLTGLKFLLITILLSFIMFMIYQIAIEVNQFWFQKQKFSNKEEKDQNIMETIRIQSIKNEQNNQNQHIQSLKEKQKNSNQASSSISQLQHQKQYQVLNPPIQNSQNQQNLQKIQQTSNKFINPQEFIQISKQAQILNNNNNNNNNVNTLIHSNNNDREFLQRSYKNKKFNTYIFNFKDKLPNYNYSIQQIRRKEQSNTILPQVKNKSQLYDPVLKSIYQMKKRSKGRFRQTVFTMRNTKINYDQYERSKNLIEIMNYWNAKQQRIVVKNNQKKLNQDNQDQQIKKINNQVNQYCEILSIKDKFTCQQKQNYLNSLIKQEKIYYQKKYEKMKQTIKQLGFCIIVPSYKNNKNNNYKKNLNSILMQQYSNYHIIYIDDFSNDGTVQAVKEYINENEISSQKIKLIENKQNKKALYNIYHAAHNQCKQNQIMIIIDGDDYLIGRQALRFLNFQYQDKKILTAYTNYLRIHEPYYIKVGTSIPYKKLILDKSQFRIHSKQFCASHLRSYFVKLFKKIKIQDLQDSKGQFFTAANDFAIMMPILQMASPYIQYLAEITYLYDSGTGFNNFESKVGKQLQNAQIIKNRKKYVSVSYNQIFPTINNS